MTHVTVSIVSADECERLARCLESVAMQDFDGTLSVVVVKNGVEDGSDTTAQRILPDVHIVRNSERRGFAENHNAALSVLPSDYGLILNPDVILAQNCIRELIAAMQRHRRAGVMVPLLFFPSGKPQPSARQFPRIGGTVLRRTPLRRVFAKRIASSSHYLSPPDSDRQIDWALGACLFVRAAAWRQLGGFDPKFPLYVEDVDLAWRAWQAGWETWQSPSARALHEHQAITDKAFLHRRTLWHMHGMLRFVRKHPRILLSGERPAMPRAAAKAHRAAPTQPQE